MARGFPDGPWEVPTVKEFEPARDIAGLRLCVAGDWEALLAGGGIEDGEVTSAAGFEWIRGERGCTRLSGLRLWVAGGWETLLAGGGIEDGEATSAAGFEWVRG